MHSGATLHHFVYHIFPIFLASVFILFFISALPYHDLLLQYMNITMSWPRCMSTLPSHHYYAMLPPLQPSPTTSPRYMLLQNFQSFLLYQPCFYFSLAGINQAQRHVSRLCCCCCCCCVYDHYLPLHFISFVVPLLFLLCIRLSLSSTLTYTLHLCNVLQHNF